MSEHFKYPNNFIEDQFVPYFKEEELKNLVKDLGRKISKKYKGQDLVIIGVLKGSLTFMADLCREIQGVEVVVDFVKIQSVGRSEQSDGTISLQKDVKTDLLNKNILIVEDIVDKGRALDFIIKRVNASQPKNVEVITLFDKPYMRKVKVPLDYIGQKIDLLFIVGYGMDLDDYGRNLKEVYYLKYPN